MGCDIHAYVERKVNDKWIMVRELSDGARARNYSRFAALAGVRGEGPDPKGVPEDVSDSVALHIKDWGSDGHSHSWMMSEEAAQIWLRTENNPKSYTKENPEGHFFDIYDDKKCECCGRGLMHRIVFFFDN